MAVTFAFQETHSFFSLDNTGISLAGGSVSRDDLKTRRQARGLAIRRRGF